MEGDPMTAPMTVPSAAPVIPGGTQAAGAPGQAPGQADAAGADAAAGSPFAAALAEFLDSHGTGPAAAEPPTEGEPGTDPATPAAETLDGAVAVLQNLLTVAMATVVATPTATSNAASAGTAPTSVGLPGAAAASGDPAAALAATGLPAAGAPVDGAAATAVGPATTATTPAAGAPAPGDVATPSGLPLPSAATPATSSDDAATLPVLATAAGPIPVETATSTGRPGTPAAETAPVLGAADTTSTPAVSTPTPASPAAPVTGTAAAGAARAPEQPVATQMVRQFAVLHGAPDGAYTMTVQITPDDLGPVGVQVTVENGVVEMTLRGAHEHGRTALIQALPDLRRELEGAGLSCNRVEVDLDNDQSSWFSSQPDAGGNHEGHDNHATRRARSWMSSGDNSDNSPVVAADQSTPTGVDVRM